MAYKLNLLFSWAFWDYYTRNTKIVVLSDGKAQQSCCIEDHHGRAQKYYPD